MHVVRYLHQQNPTSHERLRRYKLAIHNYRMILFENVLITCVIQSSRGCSAEAHGRKKGKGNFGGAHCKVGRWACDLKRAYKKYLDGCGEIYINKHPTCVVLASRF
jgi:hypothetical protein